MKSTNAESLVAAGSRTIVLALVALLVVALQPGEAAACSCAEFTTADAVGRADLVFVGQEISRLDTAEPWPSVAVTFEIVEAYKGAVESQMTVWTGAGDGDCGVAPQAGLIGIAAYSEGGRPLIDLCGSVHNPAAIAAVLDPIDMIVGQPAPIPTSSASSGISPWVWVGAGGALIAAGAALLVARRRRDDYQDGWNRGA